MTDTGWTEGPWVLTHVDGSNFAIQRFEIRGKGNVFPVFNRSLSAVDCGSIYVSPQDAALIAAAPEMFSDLSFAVKLLEGMPGFRGTAQVERMKATLNKALGK